MMQKDSHVLLKYGTKAALLTAAACVLTVGSCLYFQPGQAEASDHHYGNNYPSATQLIQTLMPPDVIAANVAASLNVSLSDLFFDKIDLERRDHDDPYQYPEFYYKVSCGQGSTGYYCIVDARNGQMVRSDSNSFYRGVPGGVLTPADLMDKVAAALNVGKRDLLFNKIELEHRDHDDYYQYPEFYYEIKCSLGDTRYEYKLDAQNGQIIRSEAKHSKWH